MAKLANFDACCEVVATIRWRNVRTMATSEHGGEVITHTQEEDKKYY